MIKAVIFDFDETLVESRLTKWAQHIHVAKKFYNIDLTHEKIRKHWGKPLPVLISELYQNSDTPDNMRSALRSTRNDFLKKLYKESLYVIKTLLGKEMKIGVLSATDRHNLEEDLIRLDFPLDKFIAIQGCDESEKHKPDPEVFLPILEKFKKEGINKEEIVYVGDSMDDYLAATGAGLGFIGITTGLYTKEDFENVGAKQIVDNIEKVLQYL
jgi:phosphoglycolate phosphatase